MYSTKSTSRLFQSIIESTGGVKEETETNEDSQIIESSESFEFEDWAKLNMTFIGNVAKEVKNLKKNGLPKDVMRELAEKHERKPEYYDSANDVNENFKASAFGMHIHNSYPSSAGFRMESNIHLLVEAAKKNARPSEKVRFSIDFEGDSSGKVSKTRIRSN